MRTSALARLFTVDHEDDWRARAACTGMDPEHFFSAEDIPNLADRQDREAGAKAICARCEVSAECLDYAIDAGERYGIWGGMNPQERRAFLRARASNPAAGERVS